MRQVSRLTFRPGGSFDADDCLRTIAREGVTVIAFLAPTMIHMLLDAADRSWAAVAGQSVFGPRARWRAMREALSAAGVQMEPQRRSVRDAVLTVPWSAVAPPAPPLR